MSEISAKAVMELRQATGCGLMECKKSLDDCSGRLILSKTRNESFWGLKKPKKRAYVWPVKDWLTLKLLMMVCLL